MSVIAVDVVLDALGLDYSVRGNEANALCPAHKRIVGREDHSPSWWVNLETGRHICFSCHYSGGLLTLVADVQGFYTELWGDEVHYDFDAARAWLANVSEVDPDRLAALLTAVAQYAASERAEVVVPMSRARLAVFVDPPADAMEARQVSAEAVEHYGVRWDPNKRFWVLPIYQQLLNDNGENDEVLLGWQEKGQYDRHFFNRPPGMKKSRTLFGIPQLRDDRVILVESPLDCLRLHTAGLPGAVAICGSEVSEYQFRLIRSSASVILALDNDSAGQKGSKALLELCTKYGVNARFFNYGSTGKKDPGDMTDAELVWGVENAISYLYGERAYVQGQTVSVSGARPADSSARSRPSSVRDGSW